MFQPAPTGLGIIGASTHFGGLSIMGITTFEPIEFGSSVITVKIVRAHGGCLGT
jgi:hypothetical protein